MGCEERDNLACLTACGRQRQEPPAQSQNVDVIANNLANTDTMGFKKDLPTFKEYLASVERTPEPLDIPRGPIKDKDMFPLDGRDQAFVVVDGTYTNFRPGTLRVTQSPLDVAMDGPGFLEVSTPDGVRYTRQGSLKVAMDGRLVTNQGYPVLAAQPGGLAAPPAENAQPGQGRTHWLKEEPGLDANQPLTMRPASSTCEIGARISRSQGRVRFSRVMS